MFEDLRAIAYYGKDRAQSKFWTDFNPAIIAADLARIREIGSNAVRICIWPQTTQQQFWDFMGLAREAGLKVKVAFAPAPEESWINAYLGPYRSDPTIVSVDLWNEMPLTEANLDWARAVLPEVKRIVGRVPVTISVSGEDLLDDLDSLIACELPLDYYEVHYYGPGHLAYWTLDLAQPAAGVNQTPLLVGETGYSTFPGRDGRSAGDNEYRQGKHIRQVAAACRELGLPLPCVWCYSDYTPEASPGYTGADLCYGLWRVDGSGKLARGDVGDLLNGITDNGFNGDFAWGLTGWSPWLLHHDSYYTSALPGEVAALKLFHTGTSPSGEPALVTTPVIPTVPGRTYRLSCDMKADRATGTSRPKIAWFDAAGKWLSNGSGQREWGTFDWRRVWVDSTMPGGAAFAELHLVSAGNSGSVWYSDVKFEGLGG